MRPALAGLGARAALACRKPPETPSQGGTAAPSYTPPDQEPPVALNADSPIQYPPALFDQKVEGDVVLRLFVDSTGHLRPESTKVAESSGYPALDSAAVAGGPPAPLPPAPGGGPAPVAGLPPPHQVPPPPRPAPQ